MAEVKTETKTAPKAKKKTISKESLNLRSDIKDKVEQNEENNFDISILMSDIYHGKLFEEWGYTKFKDYTENELGIKDRTALWHVNNGDAIKAVGLSKEDIAGLGFSKFKELSSIITKATPLREAKRLIEEAKDKTFKEVKDIVKSKKLRSEVVEKTMDLTFTVSDDQATSIMEALNTCGDLIGSTNTGIQLEYIVTEWFSRRNDKLKDAIMAQLVGKETERVPYKKDRLSQKGKETVDAE